MPPHNFPHADNCECHPALTIFPSRRLRRASESPPLDRRRDIQGSLCPSLGPSEAAGSALDHQSRKGRFAAAFNLKVSCQPVGGFGPARGEASDDVHRLLRLTPSQAAQAAAAAAKNNWCSIMMGAPSRSGGGTVVFWIALSTSLGRRVPGRYGDARACSSACSALLCRVFGVRCVSCDASRRVVGPTPTVRTASSRTGAGLSGRAS